MLFFFFFIKESFVVELDSVGNYDCWKFFHTTKNFFFFFWLLLVGIVFVVVVEI